MSTSRKHNIMERAQHTYFQLPKLLMYGEKYANQIKPVDKVAYAVLLDRLNVSVKNGWIDDNGDIYFVYSNNNLMEVLNVSKSTVIAIKKRLTEAGLLLEEATGRANRLYLLEPVPANEEEAKYIIQKEHEEIEDESKMTEEEKRKISDTMKKTKGSEKQSEQDEVQKSDFAFETPSNQRFSNLENKTKSKNQTSEVQKLDPSKNNLSSNKDDKEYKDNKESSYTKQNQQLEEIFDANVGDYDTERELIDNFIEDNNLVSNYGEYIVSNFKKYSNGSFDTFKLFYEKLYYAHKSAEKEKGIQFMLDDYFTKHADSYKKEISKTFWRVIQQYRMGKVKKSLNDLLFTSFKNNFRFFADSVLQEQESAEGKEDVPLYDWTTEQDMD